MMETTTMGIPPQERGNGHETETSFHGMNPAEYAEFLRWKTQRAAEKAAAAEAEREERAAERMAQAVYRHQVRRGIRALTKAANAALVGAVVVATAALLMDTYKEE